MNGKENGKHGNHVLQVIYIIWLTLQIVFNLFYLRVVLTSMDKKRAFALYIIIAVVYAAVTGILGILNIIKGIAAYRRGNQDYCLDAMLKLKYGLVPFFLLNAAGIGTLLFLALVVSRGMILLWFPGLVIFVGATVLGAWLIMLPGSFYAFFVLRFAQKEGKITRGWMLVHMLWQCLFLADTFDAAYLAVKYFDKGKRGAMIIAAECLFMIILCAAGVILMFIA